MQPEPALLKAMRRMTITLGIMCFAFVAFAVTNIEEPSLQARLLPDHMRGMVPWKTISAEEIEMGIAAPAHVNILFQIPAKEKKIYRKVLFGNSGFDVRYWGYCFPEDYEKMQQMKRRGFPGRIFLSEKERQFRREKEINKRRTQFSLFRDYSEKNLNEAKYNRGQVRHQMEIFEGGTTCYLMTETPISIGIDRDGDGVNAYIEADKKSDPDIEDTDGDGLDDGIEIFSLGTSPIMRDSDGDGIVDGLEDYNRNGRVDMGETNPLQIDSDRDGLCDGLCRIDTHSKKVRGEDVNLNGKIDKGETDPTKEDSDGDGILDEQEYFNCVLKGSKSCSYSAFQVK